MPQGSSESRRSFYRSQTLRRNVLSREFLFSIKRSFSLSLLLTPSLCENNMLRVSWSPDLLLKSRLRRALAKLCEGKGENSCFIEIALSRKRNNISCAMCVLHRQAPQRTVTEREFILSEKDFFLHSIFLFFFFSLKNS
jgi:hypothetical protein